MKLYTLRNIVIFFFKTVSKRGAFGDSIENKCIGETILDGRCMLYKAQKPLVLWQLHLTSMVTVIVLRLMFNKCC
jgi:hypothetical protein